MEHTYEKEYQFILEKCINYNNSHKFTNEHEISEFLDTIIQEHKEMLDHIFNNNTEIKEEDNVTWVMDGILLKVMFGPYGTFIYTRVLNKLCNYFGVTNN